MAQPKISIVTYCGEHALLPEMFAGLAAQDAAPADFEVVIVDYDPSTDWIQHSAKFAREHPQLTFRYFQMENGTRARALNFGVQHSAAPIVVLLADDFMPDAGLVSAHLKFHEANPANETVGIGPGLFPDRLRDCEFRRWLENSGTLFGVSFTDGRQNIPEDFFYAANTSLKKSFFLEAGGLDEDFPYAAWDDYELSLRLKASGMRAKLVSRAIALHEHPVTLDERRAAMREAGTSAAIFERKHTYAQPWQLQCAQAPWLHNAKAAYAGFKNRLTHNPADLEKYYRKTLAASFVGAYRAAKTD